MCVRKEGNHMMKRSQTKKISAMLAAMAALWGTLTFGGDSVSAAVDQAAVLQKVALMVTPVS